MNFEITKVHKKTRFTIHFWTLKQISFGCTLGLGYPYLSFLCWDLNFFVSRNIESYDVRKIL